MAHTLAVVKFRKISGIPQDVVQNSWAFTHADPLDNSIAIDLTGALDAFYNKTNGDQTEPVTHYFSQSISEGSEAQSVDFYNVGGHEDGTPHGAPLFTKHLSPTLGVGDDALPDEVAVCLSFHSAYGTDVEFGGGGIRPRARDRGRLYLGPLSTICISRDTTTGAVTVKDVVRMNIALAADHMRDDTLGGGPYFDTIGAAWCVWSRKTASFKTVTGGWVDDAFDTQRRRGSRPTERNNW